MTRAWLLLAGLTLAACATTRAEASIAPAGAHASGVYHTVQRGQTLWRIAHTYGVSVEELRAANRLAGTELAVGARLWIPRASHVLEITPAGAPVAAAPPAKPPAPPARPAKPPEKPHEHPQVAAARSAPPSHSRFIWPVSGPVESPFGQRGNRQHDGIDIKANKGTPVIAADSGEVLYAGVQRGYGNIVLIKHTDDLITIYAHNDANRVKVGDHVKKGQVIAVVGQTGRATNNHLHFEVRKNRVPTDPLLYLPETRESLASTETPFRSHPSGD